MTDPRRPILALSLTLSVLAAACQGAAPATPPPTAPPAPTAGAASPAPAPPASPAPATSPAPAASTVSSPVANPDGPPEQTSLTATFGTVTGADAPLWIAVEEGLFRKYGLDVSAQLASTSTGVAALMSNQTPIIANDGASTIQAISQGADLTIVGYIDRTNPYAIVSQPSITTVDQLRGKTLVIQKAGDTTEISARMALTPAGIILGQDVTPIYGGNSPDRLTALLTGQADAALLNESVLDQAHGMNVLVNLSEQHIPYIGEGLITTKTFARNNPNTVLAFLKGVTEGTRYFADPANRQASQEAIAKYVKQDPSSQTVSDLWTFYHNRPPLDLSPTPDAADTILTALRQISPTDYGALTAQQVTDPSFSTRLHNEGFIAN